MSHAADMTELDALLSTLLDGSLSAADAARLEALASSDAAAMTRLLDLLDLQSVLAWKNRNTADVAPADADTNERELAALPLKPDLSPLRAKVRVTRPPYIAYALAAALLIAACGLAIFVFTLKPETSNPKPAAQPIATILDTSDNATLVINDKVVAAGSEVRSGDVSLDTGSAQLRLHSGVEVRLVGDTQLRVIDDMHASLARGSAHFDCPHTKPGYTVHLPDGSRVVDIGTAFRVTVDDAGRCFVRVTEGRVAVYKGEQIVDLSAGRSARIDMGGPIVALDPADVADLVLAPAVFDLRADDAVTADDDAVTAWGPFAQPAAEHRPQLVDDPAGPFVRFDGVGDFLAADPYTAGRAITLTAVLRRAPASADDERQLYNGPIVATFTTAHSIQAWSYVDRARRGEVRSDPIPADRWIVVTYVYDAAAKQARLYVDGHPVAESAADTPLRAAERQFLGTHNGMHEYFAGDLRRLVLHAAALDESTVLDLHAALSDRDE